MRRAWALLAWACLGACAIDVDGTKPPPIDSATLQEIRATEDKLRASPDDTALHVRLGDLYTRAGRTFEAAEAYANAVDRAPAAEDARVKLAEAYVKLGYTMRAFEQLRGCLDKNDRSPDCLYMVGTLLRQDGTKAALQQALRVYERLIETAPDHPRAAQAKTAVEQLRVQVSTMKGPSGEEEAAAASPHGGAPSPHGAGGSPHGSGPPATSPHAAVGGDAKVGDQAVGELNPYGKALAKAYEAGRRNDLAAAEAGFREALALRRGDPAAMAGLGQIFLAKGDTKQALEIASMVYAEHPEDMQARWIFGMVMLKTRKDVAQGMEAWRSIAKDDPEYAEQLGIPAMLKAFEKEPLK